MNNNKARKANDPEIYFHAGLGKAASTFLQHKVFPHFKGVHYIPRNRFHQHEKIISTTAYDSYLLSREFGRNFAEKITHFAKAHPQARIIMVLRRHDTWVASQYRRYVKNGGCASFEQFLDMENDRGVWKKGELIYLSRLQLIEKLFSHKPYVVIYENLREAPYRFIDTIARYVGATYDKEQVSLKPAHKSYRDSELILLQNINRNIFRSDPKPSQNQRVEWLKRRLRMYFAYLVLYPAKWFNRSNSNQTSLVSQDSLQRIRDYYEDDWRQCLEYVETDPHRTAKD